MSKIHETSLDIIEETVVDDNNDEDDESSRESTDFLTMQPASTQYFDSESQSQLCVQQLQRRVRNMIGSSDDDLSNCDRENGEASQEKYPRKSQLSNNHVVSDDDTDVESSQITRRISLRKNKPIITSESDGDNTDIEATDNVTTTRIHEDDRSTDTNRSQYNTLYSLKYCSIYQLMVLLQAFLIKIYPTILIRKKKIIWMIPT